jgi:cysteinyl-tRNA synthetase
MARRYLGDRFDVHTGGIDNIFPHHEDEIAQSAPIVGGPPARIWVHGEHLLMAGRKMAKSAGNFQRVTELGDEGIEPLAFRYLVLTSRYAHKLNYSDESIGGAAAAFSSLRIRLAALGPPPSNGAWVAPPVLTAGAAGDRPVGTAEGAAGFGGGEYVVSDRAHAPAAPLSATGAALHARFVDALDADLDLPAALVTVREMLRADLPPDERRWLVLDFDFVLGLDLDRGAGGNGLTPPAELPPNARELLEARAAARAARDFGRADELRLALRDLGVEVTDRPDGTSEARALADDSRS